MIKFLNLYILCINEAYICDIIMVRGKDAFRDDCNLCPFSMKRDLLEGRNGNDHIE